MNDNVIHKPNVYFSDLGGLHDAVITDFSWNQDNQVLKIGVDDLNSNFLDLPEYEGLRTGQMLFTGVRNFDFDIQLKDSDLSIYSFLVEEEMCYSVYIKCSPGGYIKCQCKEIKIIDL
jgi:hypothetical protein